MTKQKCYFKSICETGSKEGLAFLDRFAIDVENCRYKCLGFFGYGECENFMTRHEAVEMGGLARLLKQTERR